MFYSGVLELGETYTEVFEGVQVNETAVEELMESGATSLLFKMRGYAQTARGKKSGEEVWGEIGGE